MGSAKYFIGTSGWQYKDWNQRFYPKEITGKRQLSYYSNIFNSVEINSTFYRMPKESSVAAWVHSVPDDFKFCVKANRYFTHLKRLNVDADFIDRLNWMADTLAPMGAKLGFILIQLPPNLKKNTERLEKTIEVFKEKFENVRIALEFRGEDWFKNETYEILRQYNVANVINDAPKNRWPLSKEITADWLYVRFHGSRRLYQTNYAKQQLGEWADFISGKDIKAAACYFNNDFHARAAFNAQMLNELLLKDS